MNTNSAVPIRFSRTFISHLSNNGPVNHRLAPLALCLLMALAVISGCKSQSSQPQMPTAGSPGSPGSPSSSSPSSSSSSGSGSSGSSSPSAPSPGGAAGGSGSPGVTPTISTNSPPRDIFGGSQGSQSGSSSSGGSPGSGSTLPGGGSGNPVPMPGTSGGSGSTYDPAARSNTGQAGSVGTQGTDGNSSTGSADGKSDDNSPWGSSNDPGNGEDSGLPSDRATPSDDIDFSEAESGGDVFGDSAGSPGGGQGGGASTVSEQVAVLDEELEGSMRTYDDMILKERAYVIGQGAEDGAEEQLEQYEQGELYDDVLGTEQEDESPQVARAGGNGDSPVVTGPPGAPVPGDGRRQPAEAFPPPDDIPSGDNDDVVARQIREAAMYEKDPELREKLWEEYRKYKEQTQ